MYRDTTGEMEQRVRNDGFHKEADDGLPSSTTQHARLLIGTRWEMKFGIESRKRLPRLPIHPENPKKIL
jgi:hypothetical protein